MKVIVYGTGQMAEFIGYSFMHDSIHELVAFCVDDAYIPVQGSRLMGLPVLGFDQLVTEFPAESHALHIAIGRNSVRERIYHIAKKAGYAFVNYISSRANVWPDLVVGENVFIDQCTAIQPFVTIGNNCMLIGARIGHHSVIKDNVLLSGNILAGNVTVGAGSFLGMNSAVKEGVCIGSNNIIGVGVFINRDTEDNALISNSMIAKRTGDAKRFVMFSKTNEQKSKITAAAVTDH